MTKGFPDKHQAFTLGKRRSLSRSLESGTGDFLSDQGFSLLTLAFPLGKRRSFSRSLESGTGDFASDQGFSSATLVKTHLGVPQHL